MQDAVASLTIGALANAAAVNVETIRFYQRRGLLAEPDRPFSGSRRYGEGHVMRVRFIKAAQRLGFTLDEVAECWSSKTEYIVPRLAGWPSADFKTCARGLQVSAASSRRCVKSWGVAALRAAQATVLLLHPFGTARSSCGCQRSAESLPACLFGGVSSLAMTKRIGPRWDNRTTR